MEPEAYSLFGEPLWRAPPNEEAVKTQRKLYDEALKDYKKDPDDPDNIIWMGRRTAYLGDYRKAIAIFREGVRKHPEDPRMYRHRGHRFISLRFFDQAVMDLEKAAILIKGKPDEIEPNGIANARGVALGTLRFNIMYHLGLAYYLKGESENALDAYERCMDASTVDDKKISTGHWYYMTLRRLGMDGKARKLLEGYSRDMDVVENMMYLDCIMMYKGKIPVEELVKKSSEMGSLGLATTGYGVANWYNYNGEKEKAVDMYRKIISQTVWPGFGHIAAEADLYRLGEIP